MPPPSATLDHFLCYKAKKAKGEEKSQARGAMVPLWDQFQQRTVELHKVEQFCNPVYNNKEDIPDPTRHLTCYKVKKPASSTKADLISTDQFGDLGLSLRNGRNQLCVPSDAVAVVDPTPTPVGSPTPTATPAPDLPLEQFELYKVKKARGASRFQRLEGVIADEFLDQYIIDDDEEEPTNMTVKLTRPMNLGAPTAEFYKDIVNPLTHLTCYKVQAPRFRRLDVFVSNRFDTWYKLTVKKPEMLCVPSYKEVVSDD